MRTVLGSHRWPNCSKILFNRIWIWKNSPKLSQRMILEIDSRGWRIMINSNLQIRKSTSSDKTSGQINSLKLWMRGTSFLKSTRMNWIPHWSSLKSVIIEMKCCLIIHWVSCQESMDNERRSWIIFRTLLSYLGAILSYYQRDQWIQEVDCWS